MDFLIYIGLFNIIGVIIAATLIVVIPVLLWMQLAKLSNRFCNYIFWKKQAQCYPTPAPDMHARSNVRTPAPIPTTEELKYILTQTNHFGKDFYNSEVWKKFNSKYNVFCCSKEMPAAIEKAALELGFYYEHGPDDRKKHEQANEEAQAELYRKQREYMKTRHW